MNFRFTVVETSLNRAEFRWKGLRLLQHTAILGVVLCTLLLVLGLAILAGWIVNRGLVLALLWFLGAASFVSWAVLLISILAGAPDRAWLAAAVEHSDRRLLDRINTLLFLENRRGDKRAESFALRIARQVQRLLAQQVSPSPFSPGTAVRWFFLFLALLALTVSLGRVFSPWSRLVTVQVAKAAPPASEKPRDLALPPTNNLEQNLPWGEVRITDPGTDLHVSKVDVVPLQIEAAANQALSQVSWSSTINGQGETSHSLPPPREPRYAVYQPSIYLDELGLSDWDVMTYYAKADTESTNSYASEVYFLEVRPFREDLLKLPGGEGGSAYRALNELTGLIHRQQHVIRATHQHLQNPQPQQKLQAQDRKKLADAEQDLSGSAEHLYARLAAEMENKPIGEALDNLAKAQKSLDNAGHLLADNVMPEAQNRERGGLSELLAARKMFQKAISDNPDAFRDQNNAAEDEEHQPTGNASKKLKEIAEFRNESRAAQDFVQKTIEQQRSLEQQARSLRPSASPSTSSAYSRLSAQEQQLQKSLQDFEAQHPQPFQSAQDESQRAQQMMRSAANALQNRSPQASGAMQQATQSLNQLAQAMQDQSAEQQLADAYRLKKMLDRQIQTLDKRSQPDSGISDSELQNTAGQARQTVDQLKKSAEEEPTRDAFGQPLRDALSGQNKMDLDTKLAQLQQAQDEIEKQQRAGEAKQRLAQVSKAFEQSQPKSLQMARKNDALKPNGQDSFGQGMSELESLIKQLEKNPRFSADRSAKQGQQALSNLQSGMRAQYGDDQAGNQLLQRLQKALEEKSLDPGDLKMLLQQLQRFATEASTQLAKKETQPDVLNIDPAKLPAAYRGRIQKYFEKLSEK